MVIWLQLITEAMVNLVRNQIITTLLILAGVVQSEANDFKQKLENAGGVFKAEEMVIKMIDDSVHKDLKLDRDKSTINEKYQYSIDNFKKAKRKVEEGDLKSEELFEAGKNYYIQAFNMEKKAKEECKKHTKVDFDLYINYLARKGYRKGSPSGFPDLLKMYFLQQEASSLYRSLLRQAKVVVYQQKIVNHFQ